MTPDESTIEILENRIESLKNIAEKSSSVLNEYMEGMFGIPTDIAIAAPDPKGIVENAPVINKINFMLDEAFIAIYDVENNLDILKSTIPSRITGYIDIAHNLQEGSE